MPQRDRKRPARRDLNDKATSARVTAERAMPAAADVAYRYPHRTDEFALAVGQELAAILLGRFWSQMRKVESCYDGASHLPEGTPMRVIQMTATTGADGHLRLDIPTGTAGATFDVAVVPHTPPTANGTGHKPTPDGSVSSPGSLASLYGCITDEAFVAPPRGLPRSVPSLDSD